MPILKTTIDYINLTIIGSNPQRVAYNARGTLNGTDNNTGARFILEFEVFRDSLAKDIAINTKSAVIFKDDATQEEKTALALQIKTESKAKINSQISRLLNDMIEKNN